MADLIGSTIGQYQIVELLGRGGMADVYKAFHADLELYRAIKFIRPEFVQEDDFRARFRREAQSVAVLRHPSIVQVQDFGSHEDSFYMVMEFIEGQDLKNVIQERGRIEPISEAVRWVCQIASALEYAHGEGLVHRDIKPENIMLNTRGVPILMDFGIAKLLEGKTQLTQTGIGIGTPAYMAPEQVRGERDIGPAADVYALGIVLYELLTGTTPFKADTPVGVMMRAISDPLPLPRRINSAISQSLQDVIVDATMKTPSERTATASEFATRLQASERIKAPKTKENATTSHPAPIADTSGTPPTSRLPRDVTYRRLENQIAERAEVSPEIKDVRKSKSILYGVAALVVALLILLGTTELISEKDRPKKTASRASEITIYDRKSIARIQSNLQYLGYLARPPSGSLDPDTQSSIAEFMQTFGTSVSPSNLDKVLNLTEEKRHALCIRQDFAHECQRVPFSSGWNDPSRSALE